MKSWIRPFGTSLIGVGIDPRRLLAALRALPRYVVDVGRYISRRDAEERRLFSLRLVPTLSDLYSQSGVARGHYFHQDLWAAREVFARQPVRHVDVGSRIDGFIAHLLCFREVDVIDIRKLESHVRGLRFLQADMMADNLGQLTPADSVSCLHALEHFGLGRYGDPLVVDGWRRGLKNLSALVADGGTLLLSVPVGKPRVEFNAQRIFAPSMIVDEALRLGLHLKSFSLVNDQGDFSDGVSTDQGLDLDFGCGCFIFKRRAAES